MDLGFWKRLQDLDPKLIHLHDMHMGVFPIWYSQKLKIPLVSHIHGPVSKVGDYKKISPLTLSNPFQFGKSVSYRRFLQNIDLFNNKVYLFLAVSNFIKERAIQRGLEKEKIVVHHNCVDHYFFSPDPSIPREPIVLFVGRLIDWKGCDYFIHAMKIVQRTRPEAQAIIVGDGPERPFLENLAKQFLSNYKFLGWLSPAGVKEWMNKALVFCAPSTTDSLGRTEAFGTVFAEAQAMEIPIVSFNVGGISEVVNHEETGFLAPDKDWEMLANYILKLFEDQNLWQSLGKNGREHVKRKFDPVQQNLKLERIYDSVLEGKTPNDLEIETRMGRRL
jgi:glycosyltransferase involved in cell wall biosynthesis